MKKTLTDIDGALAVQRATVDRPPLEGSKEKSASKPRSYDQTDRTFGIDGHLGIWDKVGVFDGRGEILYVEEEMYHLTPGLNALITHKHQEREEYTDYHYTTYRAFVAQTNAKISPNHAATTNPWKWRHMLGEMLTPMESLPDEEEETDSEDVDNVPMEDTGESTDSGILSPPSPVHTRES